MQNWATSPASSPVLDDLDEMIIEAGRDLVVVFGGADGGRWESCPPPPRRFSAPARGSRLLCAGKGLSTTGGLALTPNHQTSVTVVGRYAALRSAGLRVERHLHLCCAGQPHG